jgi:molybdopterin/thiamine biosynthesis adenylyltransferase
VLEVKDLHVGKGDFHARVRIATGDIECTPSGLPINADHEDVELWFDDGYPNYPPTAIVTHGRFAGHPHVLIGRILCIYLDTDREWHPAIGVHGVLDRLVEWLRDAAADRFDRRAALYHPIGGLPPSPRVGGALVVRPPSVVASRRPIARAAVNVRSPHRSDLIRWSTRTKDDPPTTTDALVLRAEAMPWGLVQVDTVGKLFARLEHAGGPRSTDSLAAMVRLLRDLGDNPLRVIVEVAHPTDRELTYIASAVGRALVPSAVAQRPDNTKILRQLAIGWTTVSDERPEVATRRDSRRPTTAFAGKTVEIWGCGGLGSWMAEFITRAGARRILVRDTGAVAEGLLVRQNYSEADVGLSKADQLALRLEAIAGGIDIDPLSTNVLDLLADGLSTPADVLIDATINVTVAARLDEWKRATSTAPLLAQVATDPRTATLGLLVVAANNLVVGPASIDDATWATISSDPTTERFHGFWTPPVKGDQIVPALGCSTPTFHGSAADLASLAGSLVSLLAGHVGTTASGAHLIESGHAHGREGGGHLFIPYVDPVFPG